MAYDIEEYAPSTGRMIKEDGEVVNIADFFADDPFARKFTGNSDPTVTETVSEGDFWFKSDTDQLYVYDGSAWDEIDTFAGAENHSALTNLDADDHTQYHTDARGDARYSLLAHLHDDRYYTEAESDGLYAPIVHTHAHTDTTGKTATDHHSNANDPSADEKAALAGTSGTPGADNKYVTNDDSRNTDSRTPSSHASSHENAGGDEISLAGLSGDPADTINKSVLTEQGDVLYASGVGTPAALPHGNAGDLLTSGGDGANPAWAAPAGGGGGSAGTPWFRTGHYYTIISSQGDTAAGAPTAGRIHAVPLDVFPSTVFTHIAVEVTVDPGSQELYRLGIYSDTGGIPVDLVIDAGTIDADAGTGIQSIAFGSPQTLEGKYWLVCQTEDAGIGAQLRLFNAPYNSLLGYPSATANFYHGSRYPFLESVNAWGALPDPYPFGSDSDFSVAGIPIICLKVQ